MGGFAVSAPWVHFSRRNEMRKLDVHPVACGEKWLLGFHGAGSACLFSVLLGSALPARAAQPDVERGKEKYRQFCAVCHGASGRGDGPAAAALNPKPRNYTDKEFVARMTDRAMFEIIKQGGAAVKKSPSMPAWGEALRDEEIHDLIAYIRSLAFSQGR